jgi:hypothetical protein
VCRIPLPPSPPLFFSLFHVKNFADPTLLRTPQDPNREDLLNWDGGLGDLDWANPSRLDWPVTGPARFTSLVWTTLNLVDGCNPLPTGFARATLHPLLELLADLSFPTGCIVLSPGLGMPNTT